MINQLEDEVKEWPTNTEVPYQSSIGHYQSQFNQDNNSEFLQVLDQRSKVQKLQSQISMKSQMPPATPLSIARRKKDSITPGKIKLNREITNSVSQASRANKKVSRITRISRKQTSGRDFLSNPPEKCKMLVTEKSNSPIKVHSDSSRSEDGNSDLAPPLNQYDDLRRSQGENVTDEQIELLRRFEAKLNKSVQKSVMKSAIRVRQSQQKLSSVAPRSNSEMELNVPDDEESMKTPAPIVIEEDPPLEEQIPVKKKMKDRIIVLDNTFNLPAELPNNLVYWYRCETRVDQEDVISNTQLLEFYREEFFHHEDVGGCVAKVSDKPPFFRGKKMFCDPTQEKFVNTAEEKILKGNVWPDGIKKFHIEGHIIISQVEDQTIFFNSKFESGNLRQVFKEVPKPDQPQKETIVVEPKEIQEPEPQKLFQEYNLYLQDDTNSDNSLTQWFYFSCLNIKKGTIVKLNILNLMKDDSLYSMGMQPFVYSRKRHYEGDGVQWHREGFQIDYYYNDKTIRTSSKTLDMAFDPRYVENQKDKFKKMSTLSFCYEFKYDNDVVFFTHFAPYSYSDVFRYLCNLESNESLQDTMRIDYICNTLGKVPMYGLTITNNINDTYITQEQEIELYRRFEYQDYDVRPKKKKIRLAGLPGHEEPPEHEKKLVQIAHEKMFIKPKEEKLPVVKKKQAAPAGTEVPVQVNQNQEEEVRQPRYKKFIFLSSRVHPGETNSQYMIQGCIEFILSDDPVAVELRNRFIFKIIPILNPDGVIHGNYRASLMGVDLNRRWKNPSKFLHPTIYYAKSMIRFYHTLGQQPDSETGGVVFSCDMHGHSRNMNIFMYACKNLSEEPISRYPNSLIWNIPENVVQFCPIFSTKECKMALEKEKDTTARIVLFKEFGILNSYTLEATFYGSEHFKKPRPFWIKAVEDSEKLNQRYQISEQRTDIHITPQDLLWVGHDFLRGIYFAQSKKLLSFSWFDDPKKYEAIKLKEQQILAMLQKQLEELQAKEKERLRQLKIEEHQRKIREKKERKAQLKALAAQQNASLEQVVEEGEDGAKTKKKKKKKAGFRGWDDQGPDITQLNDDPAAGTAKTTNTEGTIEHKKQKKKKKVGDSHEKEMIVKIKKIKGKKDLPSLSAGKKSVNLIEVNSRYLLPQPSPAQTQNQIQNIRNSREKFGLGDNLMMQYNRYAQNKNLEQQQTFDERQKRTIDTNNKMIDLVEQILQDDLESYQQNALFPQYANQRNLNKNKVMTQQPYQQVNFVQAPANQNSKLRQVSQLMNEMVKNRRIDESKGIGIINVKNINFINQEAKAQVVSTPSGSRENERVKYNESLNGGLTVSHKIRNSSLQPYKNKVNTDGQFGAMIQGQTFGRSNQAIKSEDPSMVINRAPNNSSIGQFQELESQIERRKVSVQPNPKSFQNMDDEYDRYKKFVLFERQRYQQKQFGMKKQESVEVDTALKKYDKNINNDSSDEEFEQDVPGEEEAQLMLQEYSNNYMFEEEESFKPYIIKTNSVGPSSSSQQISNLVSPKSIVPKSTAESNNTTGTQQFYKMSSSREQVPHAHLLINQSLQGQKQNRSYQQTFHGNSLQGISRTAANSSNQTQVQQVLSSVIENRQLPLQLLRLPEIKSNMQLENSPMMKGQYQMRQSPLKQRPQIPLGTVLSSNETLILSPKGQKDYSAINLRASPQKSQKYN